VGPTAPFEEGALGQDQVPGIECCADPGGLEQFAMTISGAEIRALTRADRPIQTRSEATTSPLTQPSIRAGALSATRPSNRAPDRRTHGGVGSTSESVGRSGIAQQQVRDSPEILGTEILDLDAPARVVSVDPDAGLEASAQVIHEHLAVGVRGRAARLARALGL